MSFAEKVSGRGRGRARGANPQVPRPPTATGGRGSRGPGAPGPSNNAPMRPAQPPGSAGRASHSGAQERPQEPIAAVDKLATAVGEKLAITGRGGARTKAFAPLVRTRPDGFDTKTGVMGRSIPVQSNYFRLMTQPKWTIYQYRVDVSPPEDRVHVLRSLLRVHKAKIGGYIFDGTVLYTPFKLNPNPMVLHSRREDDTTVTFTIKLVGDVAEGDYVYLQVFNILMRKCYSTLKLQLLGRDFYDDKAKIDVREYNIQIWPGYKTTIAQHDGGILMVAEITHKIIRTDTVLSNITALKGGRNYQNAFNKDIFGQIVLTVYNNKTYRVNDVDWNSTPNSTFPYNETQISYKEYYKQKYNITIQNDDQPLLVSLAKPRDIRRGCSETIYLIPELCRMTGLTDRMRNNFRLMKDISNHTRVSPENRAQKLLAFNRRLLTSAECTSELQEWDMKLDQRLVELTGRELDKEWILQGLQGRDKYPASDTNDGWSRELRSHGMIMPASVNNWAVLTLNSLYQATDRFVKLMISAASGMQWNLPAPKMYSIQNDGVGLYISEIEKILSQGTPALIFCVVPSAKADLYNAIKKKCCVDRAIPTQIILDKTLQHKSAFSIATKIVVQMNCKMGGAPWTLNIPLDGLMVIGYDVCHNPRNKKLSYGAMVASLDRNQTKYFNCVTQHSNGEELANEFSLNIKKALQKFASLNGNKLPLKIVIYRDGVGEGQIPYVYNHEVEVIKKALEDMYGGHTYRMQFVIVSKRLNTRFFVNGRNPRPGTVIDSVVTSPERYDFFLVSQAVRDGTVSPTSYNIIYDTSGLSPDQTQKLAYKFCHMYFNYSGQVRVPSPCQYAHKLAFLVSQNIQQLPNNALNSALFFL